MPFTYNRSLTVDYTLVPSTQTDFPMLVNFTNNDLRTVGNGGNVQHASGYDVCFYSDVGLSSALFWEMESYNPVTGEVVAWVKIPSLSHTAGTVIYIAYGDSGISSFQSTASSVWDSNYKGVWHMNDNAASTTVVDSVGVFNGVNSVNTDTKDATGKIDGALDYTGASSNRTVVTYGSGLAVGSAFSLQVWIKSAVTTGAPVARWAANYTGYGLYSDGNWYSGNGTAWTSVASGRVGDSAWHSYVLVYTGSSLIAYKDGTQNASVSLTSAANDTSGLNFGRDGRAGGAEYFTGTLDEIRFSSINRSADWITTEYRNQNSPSTFYALGSEVQAGSGAARRMLTVPFLGGSRARAF